MPVIPTSGYSTLAAILPEVLKCLNDASGNLWTIPTVGNTTVPAGFINLIPSMNLAYRKIQANLANIGSPTFITDEKLFVVPAVLVIDPSIQVIINEATAPPNNLPSDLLVPSKLWERQNGSVDNFQPMTDLTDKGGLPSQAQGSSLMMWEWREDGLCFIGATQDRQVRMRYVKQLPALSDEASQLLIRNCRSSFVYFTSAIELASRGSPLAEKWDAAGNDALEVVMNRETRKSQGQPTRRRPFSSRSWQGPGGY